jgi:hypothetical protein
MKKIFLNLSLMFLLLSVSGCSRPKPEILQTDGNTISKVKCLYGLSIDVATAKESLPLIIQATSDPAPLVRRQSAFVIGKMKKDAIAGIPALITLLSDKDKDVRLTAIMMLGEMGNDAGKSVHSLIELFNQKNDQTDLLVIRTLWKIGVPAKEAVPYLEKRLVENNDGIDIQGYINNALDSITGNVYNKVTTKDGMTVTVLNSKGDIVKIIKSGVGGQRIQGENNGGE